MITYDNRFWGLHLLARAYGSAFPRAVLFAALASLETALLYEFAPSFIIGVMSNPTLFQVFGFVVGFALVFRSSLSYNRFWEARTMLQAVMGRLTYFVIETIAADLGSLDHASASPEERRAAHRFYHELTHHVSLLFALMVKQVRKDFDLSTIYEHDMAAKPPFLDAAEAITGWRRLEVFFIRALSLADLFSISHHYQESAIPVVGGLRDDEKRRLADLVPVPAMKGRGGALAGTRVYAVFALINQLYIRRIAEGGLRTHAPLVARLGGIAEEGIAAFGHCSKLATTQFPFPWAQVVLAFLVIMALFLPLVVANFVEHVWMGVVLTFIVVLAYFSLNEVAAEMEDPFGTDPNDLPLARYAYDFNNGIMSAVHQLRPPYFDELDAEMEAAAAAAAAAAAVAAASAAAADADGVTCTATVALKPTNGLAKPPPPQQQQQQQHANGNGVVATPPAAPKAAALAAGDDVSTPPYVAPSGPSLGPTRWRAGDLSHATATGPSAAAAAAAGTASSSQHSDASSPSAAASSAPSAAPSGARTASLLAGAPLGGGAGGGGGGGGPGGEPAEQAHAQPPLQQRPRVDIPTSASRRPSRASVLPVNN